MGGAVKNCRQPVIHHLSRLFELVGVRLLRRVQVSTVSTADAVGNSGELVDLRTVLQLGDPLPWILGAVGEEDVSSVDLVSITVGVKGLLDVGVDFHVELGEHHLAVVVPVLVVYLVRTDSVKSARGLEPTELSAVLVGPRSTRVVDVDRGGHDLRIGSRVVASWCVAC